MWDILIPKLNISAQKLEGCTPRSGTLTPTKNSVIIPESSYCLIQYYKKLFTQLLDVKDVSSVDVNKIVKINSTGTGLELSNYCFNSSLTTSGYIQYYTGLIIQWGYSSKTSQTDYSKTLFPITFPHACLNAIITPKLSAQNNGADWNATIMVFDNYGIWIQVCDIGSLANADGVRFLAIGY